MHKIPLFWLGNSYNDTQGVNRRKLWKSKIMKTQLCNDIIHLSIRFVLDSIIISLSLLLFPNPFSHFIRYSLQSQKWQPIPVFFPGEFHRWRNPAGYSPWSRKSRRRLSNQTTQKRSQSQPLHLGSLETVFIFIKVTHSHFDKLRVYKDRAESQNPRVHPWTEPLWSFLWFLPDQGSHFGWEVTGVPSLRALSLWAACLARGCETPETAAAFSVIPLSGASWSRWGRWTQGSRSWACARAGRALQVSSLSGSGLLCSVSSKSSEKGSKNDILGHYYVMDSRQNYRHTQTQSNVLQVLYIAETLPLLMFEWRKFKRKDPSSSSSKDVFSLVPSTQLSPCWRWKQREERSPSRWSSLHLRSSSTLPWACPPRAELRGTQGTTAISFFPKSQGSSRRPRAKVRERRAGKSWLWTLPSSTSDLCSSCDVSGLADACHVCGIRSLPSLLKHFEIKSVNR